LVDYNYQGIVANSFWDKQTTGQTSSTGGGTGLTTAQMRTRSTYTGVGWDFVGEETNGPNDVWAIKEGVDYPKLVWDRVNLVGWYEVDLADLAALANWWGRSDCAINDDCEGADIDFSGAVDIADLQVFCNYWLEGI
jgi:hypothetical protein